MENMRLSGGKTSYTKSLRPTVKMLGIFALIAVTFGSSSCGSDQDAERAEPLLESEEFASHLENFKAEASARGFELDYANLVIQFGELAPGQRASCDLGSTHKPRITVVKEKWDASSGASKELMIFHELGHCLLNRLHKSHMDDEGKPASIMHERNFDDEIYSEFRTDYVDELFEEATLPEIPAFFQRTPGR